MKTTLVIPDRIMERVRREAAKDGTTISAFVENALQLFLEKRKEPRPKLRPLPVARSGGHLVDISDRDALYQAMEDEN